MIGSTGNIGSELVNLLAEAKASVRAILRNFNHARQMPAITWLHADVSDETLFDSAERCGFGEIGERDSF